MKFFETEINWFIISECYSLLKNELLEKKVKKVIAGGKSICLVFFKENFYAVSDRCPHNGFSLSKGKCTENGAIVCPLHRYSFDIKTGKVLSGSSGNVESIPVKVESDKVFIGIARIKWVKW